MDGAGADVCMKTLAVKRMVAQWENSREREVCCQAAVVNDQGCYLPTCDGSLTADDGSVPRTYTPRNIITGNRVPIDAFRLDSGAKPGMIEAASPAWGCGRDRLSFGTGCGRGFAPGG